MLATDRLHLAHQVDAGADGPFALRGVSAEAEDRAEGLVHRARVEQPPAFELDPLRRRVLLDLRASEVGERKEDLAEVVAAVDADDEGVGRELTVYEQKSLAMRELIARHARDGPDPHPALSPYAGRRSPESRRYYLSADVAPVLFPFGATEEYDAWSYFRHKPSQRLRLPLAEHDGGSFECSTNSLGLREDAELAAARPDLRILVTGDSHTDGVCENRESYANRLEASLLVDRPGKCVEVLNAGTGGFSFHNYLGVLEK